MPIPSIFSDGNDPHFFNESYSKIPYLYWLVCGRKSIQLAL